MNRLFYIIVFVLVSSLCFVLGRATKKDIVTTQVKEVVIRDTLRFETPAYIYRNVIDTIYVPIEKTIRLHDTLFVSLPLERKVYASDEYYAEVSGYKPRLDYIEVYPKTTYITERVHVKPSKWRFDLDVGVDIGKRVNPYVSPNLGAEIGFGRWSLTGGLGCELSVQYDASMIPYMYYEIGLRYSLLK